VSDLMPLAEELQKVFARMSGLLLAEEAVQTALELVTALAVETIDAASGAGVTLIDPQGVKVTAAATSDRVGRADDLQYQLEEGPCLSAVAQLELIRVDDLERDERWPRWRAAALPLGVRSSLSAPLISQGRALGAVKVYGDQPGTFSSAHESLLRRFADQAAILLAEVSSLDRAERLSESLQNALRTRNLIALASGILMERRGLTEEQAFLQLVESARREQRELVDEATAVIESSAREPG
jgi:GAF domain-containing protein